MQSSPYSSGKSENKQSASNSRSQLQQELPANMDKSSSYSPPMDLGEGATGRDDENDEKWLEDPFYFKKVKLVENGEDVENIIEDIRPREHPRSNEMDEGSQHHDAPLPSGIGPVPSTTTISATNTTSSGANFTVTGIPIDQETLKQYYNCKFLADLKNQYTTTRPTEIKTNTLTPKDLLTKLASSREDLADTGGREIAIFRAYLRLFNVKEEDVAIISATTADLLSRVDTDKLTSLIQLDLIEKNQRAFSETINFREQSTYAGLSRYVQATLPITNTPILLDRNNKTELPWFSLNNILDGSTSRIHDGEAIKQVGESRSEERNTMDSVDQTIGSSFQSKSMRDRTNTTIDSSSLNESDSLITDLPSVDDNQVKKAVSSRLNQNLFLGAKALSNGIAQPGNATATNAAEYNFKLSGDFFAATCAGRVVNGDLFNSSNEASRFLTKSLTEKYDGDFQDILAHNGQSLKSAVYYKYEPKDEHTTSNPEHSFYTTPEAAQEIMNVESQVMLEIVKNLSECGMYEVCMHQLFDKNTGMMETNRRNLNRKIRKAGLKKRQLKQLVVQKTNAINIAIEKLSHTSYEFLKVANTVFQGGESCVVRGSLVSLLLSLGFVSVLENVIKMLSLLLRFYGGRSSSSKLERSNKDAATNELLEITFTRTFGSVNRLNAPKIFESYVRSSLIFELLGNVANNKMTSMSGDSVAERQQKKKSTFDSLLDSAFEKKEPQEGTWGSALRHYVETRHQINQSDNENALDDFHFGPLNNFAKLRRKVLFSQSQHLMMGSKTGQTNAKKPVATRFEASLKKWCARSSSKKTNLRSGSGSDDDNDDEEEDTTELLKELEELFGNPMHSDINKEMRFSLSQLFADSQLQYLAELISIEYDIKDLTGDCSRLKVHIQAALASFNAKPHLTKSHFIGLRPFMLHMSHSDSGDNIPIMGLVNKKAAKAYSDSIIKNNNSVPKKSNFFWLPIDKVWKDPTLMSLIFNTEEISTVSSLPIAVVPIANTMSNACAEYAASKGIKVEELSKENISRCLLSNWVSNVVSATQSTIIQHSIAGSILKGASMLNLNQPANLAADLSEQAIKKLRKTTGEGSGRASLADRYHDRECRSLATSHGMSKAYNQAIGSILALSACPYDDSTTSHIRRYNNAPALRSFSRRSTNISKQILSKALREGFMDEDDDDNDGNRRLQNRKKRQLAKMIMALEKSDNALMRMETADYDDDDDVEGGGDANVNRHMMNETKVLQKLRRSNINLYKAYELTTYSHISATNRKFKYPLNTKKREAALAKYLSDLYQKIKYNFLVVPELMTSGSPVDITDAAAAGYMDQMEKAFNKRKYAAMRRHNKFTKPKEFNSRTVDLIGNNISSALSSLSSLDESCRQELAGYGINSSSSSSSSSSNILDAITGSMNSSIVKGSTIIPSFLISRMVTKKMFLNHLGVNVPKNVGFAEMLALLNQKGNELFSTTMMEYLWLNAGFFSKVGTSFIQELNDAQTGLGNSLHADFKALYTACSKLSSYYCHLTASSVINARDAMMEKSASEKETEERLGKKKLTDSANISKVLDMVINSYTDSIVNNGSTATNSKVDKLGALNNFKIEGTFINDKGLMNIVKVKQLEELIGNLKAFPTWKQKPKSEAFNKSIDDKVKANIHEIVEGEWSFSRGNAGNVGSSSLNVSQKQEIQPHFWKELYRVLYNADGSLADGLVKCNITDPLQATVERISSFMNDDDGITLTSTVSAMRDMVDLLGCLYSLGMEIVTLKPFMELVLKCYSSIVLAISRAQKAFTPIPMSALLYAPQWQLSDKNYKQLVSCSISQNIIDTNKIFKSTHSLLTNELLMEFTATATGQVPKNINNKKCGKRRLGEDDDSGDNDEGVSTQVEYCEPMDRAYMLYAHLQNQKSEQETLSSLIGLNGTNINSNNKSDIDKTSFKMKLEDKLKNTNRYLDKLEENATLAPYDKYLYNVTDTKQNSVQTETEIEKQLKEKNDNYTPKYSVNPYVSCVVRPKRYPLDSNNKNILSLLYGFLQGKSHQINSLKCCDYDDYLPGNSPETLLGSNRRDYRVNHSRLAMSRQPHNAIANTLSQHVSTFLLKQKDQKSYYNLMNMFGKPIEDGGANGIDCDGNQRVQRHDKAFAPPATLYTSLRNAAFKLINNNNSSSSPGQQSGDQLVQAYNLLGITSFPSFTWRKSIVSGIVTNGGSSPKGFSNLVFNQYDELCSNDLLQKIVINLTPFHNKLSQATKQLYTNMVVLTQMPVSDSSIVSAEMKTKCQELIETFKLLKYVGCMDLMTPIDQEYVVQNYGDAYAQQKFMKKQKKEMRRSASRYDSSDEGSSNNSDEQSDNGFNDEESSCPYRDPSEGGKRTRYRDRDQVHPTEFLGRSRKTKLDASGSTWNRATAMVGMSQQDIDNNVAATIGGSNTTTASSTGSNNSRGRKLRTSDTLKAAMKEIENILKPLILEGTTAQLKRLMRMQRLMAIMKQCVDSNPNETMRGYLHSIMNQSDDVKGGDGDDFTPLEISQMRMISNLLFASEARKDAMKHGNKESIAMAEKVLGLMGILDYSQQLNESIYEDLNIEDYALFTKGSFIENGVFLSQFINNFIFKNIDSGVELKNFKEEDYVKLIKVLTLCAVSSQMFSSLGNTNNDKGQKKRRGRRSSSGGSFSDTVGSFSQNLDIVRSVMTASSEDVLRVIKKGRRAFGGVSGSTSFDGAARRSKSNTLIAVMGNRQIKGQQYKHNYLNRVAKKSDVFMNLQNQSNNMSPGGGGAYPMLNVCDTDSESDGSSSDSDSSSSDSATSSSDSDSDSEFDLGEDSSSSSSSGSSSSSSSNSGSSDNDDSSNANYNEKKKRRKRICDRILSTPVKDPTKTAEELIATPCSSPDVFRQFVEEKILKEIKTRSSTNFGTFTNAIKTLVKNMQLTTKNLNKKNKKKKDIDTIIVSRLVQTIQIMNENLMNLFKAIGGVDNDGKRILYEKLENRFCFQSLLDLTTTTSNSLNSLQKQRNEKATLLFTAGLNNFNPSTKNSLTVNMIHNCGISVSKTSSPSNRYRRGIEIAHNTFNVLSGPIDRMVYDFKNPAQAPVHKNLTESELKEHWLRNYEAINNIPYYDLLLAVAIYMTSYMSGATSSALNASLKSVKVAERHRLSVLESCAVNIDQKVRIADTFVQNSLNSRYSLIQNLLGILNPVVPVSLSLRDNNIASKALPKGTIEALIRRLRVLNQKHNQFSSGVYRSSSGTGNAYPNDTTLKRFDDAISCLATNGIQLSSQGFSLVNYDNSSSDARGKLFKSSTNNNSTSKDRTNTMQGMINLMPAFNPQVETEVAITNSKRDIKLCEKLRERLNTIGFRCDDTYSCVDRLLGENGTKKSDDGLESTTYVSAQNDPKYVRIVKIYKEMGASVLQMSNLGNLYGKMKELIAAGDNFRKLIEGPDKMNVETAYNACFCTVDGHPYNGNFRKEMRDDSPSVAATAAVINEKISEYSNRVRITFVEMLKQNKTMDEDKVLKCIIEVMVAVNGHINEITSLLHRTSASARGLEHLNSIGETSKRSSLFMPSIKSLVATIMSNSALKEHFVSDELFRDDDRTGMSENWSVKFYDLFYKWVAETKREVDLAISKFNEALHILKDLHTKLRVQLVLCSGVLDDGYAGGSLSEGLGAVFGTGKRSSKAPNKQEILSRLISALKNYGGRGVVGGDLVTNTIVNPTPYDTNVFMLDKQRTNNVLLVEMGNQTLMQNRSGIFNKTANSFSDILNTTDKHLRSLQYSTKRYDKMRLLNINSIINSSPDLSTKYAIMSSGGWFPSPSPNTGTTTTTTTDSAGYQMLPVNFGQQESASSFGSSPIHVNSQQNEKLVGVSFINHLASALTFTSPKLIESAINMPHILDDQQRHNTTALLAEKAAQAYSFGLDGKLTRDAEFSRTLRESDNGGSPSNLLNVMASVSTDPLRVFNANCVDLKNSGDGGDDLLSQNKKIKIKMLTRLMKGEAINYDNLTSYKRILFSSATAAFSNTNNYNLAVFLNNSVATFSNRYGDSCGKCGGGPCENCIKSSRSMLEQHFNNCSNNNTNRAIPVDEINLNLGTLIMNCSLDTISNLSEVAEVNITKTIVQDHAQTIASLITNASKQTTFTDPSFPFDEILCKTRGILESMSKAMTDMTKLNRVITLNVGDPQYSSLLDFTRRIIDLLQTNLDSYNTNPNYSSSSSLTNKLTEELENSRKIKEFLSGVSNNDARQVVSTCMVLISSNKRDRANWLFYNREFENLMQGVIRTISDNISNAMKVFETLRRGLTNEVTRNSYTRFQEDNQEIDLLQGQLVDHIRDTSIQKNDIATIVGVANAEIDSFRLLVEQKNQMAITLREVDNLPSPIDRATTFNNSGEIVTSRIEMQRNSMLSNLGLLSQLHDKNISEVQKFQNILRKLEVSEEKINELTHEYPIIGGGGGGGVPTTEDVKMILEQVVDQTSTLNKVIALIDQKITELQKTSQDIDSALQQDTDIELETKARYRNESTIKNRSVVTQLRATIASLDTTLSRQTPSSLRNRTETTLVGLVESFTNVQKSKDQMNLLDHFYKQVSDPIASTSAVINNNGDKRPQPQSQEKSIPTTPNFVCLLDSMHGLLVHLKRAITTDKLFDIGTILEKNASTLVSACDISNEILNSTAKEQAKVTSSGPTQRSSLICPQLCELCVMMLFNMHTVTHTSKHAYKFESKLAMERLKSLYALAVKAARSSNGDIKPLLALNDKNNSVLKGASFTAIQEVAAFTPLWRIFCDSVKNIAPDTVLMPTSELFNCPGDDYDKHRSVLNRSFNPNISDATKLLNNVVLNISTLMPLEKSIHYVSKDESSCPATINNCILNAMQSSDQQFIKHSANAQFIAIPSNGEDPTFVGRSADVCSSTQLSSLRLSCGGRGDAIRIAHEGTKSRLGLVPTPTVQTGPTTALPTEYSPAGFGGPLDMSHTHIAAPGCNLFRNRDAQFTNLDFSDLNNTLYSHNSPHVFGRNFVTRILSLIKTNTGGGYAVSDIFQNILLLGTITAHSQATLINASSTQDIVSQSIVKGDLYECIRLRRNINSLYKTGMSYALRAGQDSENLQNMGEGNRALINSLITPSMYRLKVTGGERPDLSFIEALKGNTQFQDTWQNLKRLTSCGINSNSNSSSSSGGNCAYGVREKLQQLNLSFEGNQQLFRAAAASSLRGMKLKDATEKFLQSSADILLQCSKRVPPQFEKQLGVTGKLPGPTQSPMTMILNGGYSTDPMVNQGYGLMRHLTDTFIDSVTVFSSPTNHRLLQHDSSKPTNQSIETLNKSLKGVSAYYSANDMTEKVSSDIQKNLARIEQLRRQQAQVHQSQSLQIGGVLVGDGVQPSSSSLPSTASSFFNNPGSESLRFKQDSGLEQVFGLIQDMHSVATDCDFGNGEDSSTTDMDPNSRRIISSCRSLLSGGNGTRQSTNTSPKDDFWRNLNRESLRTMIECEHYTHLSDSEKIQRNLSELLVRETFTNISNYVKKTKCLIGKALYDDDTTTLTSPTDISSPMDAEIGKRMGMGSNLNMADYLNLKMQRTLNKATMTLREQSPFYQYILIDKYTRFSNTPMSPAISRLLEDGLNAKSLRLHHSEENQCVSNLLLGNCRDSKLEKCIDAVSVLPYLLKFNYSFNKTPSDAATMITFFLSRTMGLCNSNSNVKNNSDEFSSLKNAVTDNESLLKNCVRYLRLHNRCNDAIHQVAPATCNCPFTLHHSPTTGGLDEFNNPQALNYENEFDLTEIAQNPYVANQMISMKDFVLYKSKIDPRQRGNTIIKSLLRATNCGLGSNYRDFFVPNRTSIESCVFRPAGVNLGVVVTARNLKALTTRARCWKRHICMPDLMTTTAVSFGDALATGTANEEIKSNTDKPQLRMEELAISPNTYLQHSSINPALIFVSNILFNLHTALSADIERHIYNRLNADDEPFSMMASTRDVNREVEERLKMINITEMVNGLERAQQKHMAQATTGDFESHINTISKILSQTSNRILDARSNGRQFTTRDTLMASSETMSDYEAMKQNIIRSAHTNICHSLLDNTLPYSTENQQVADIESLTAPADSRAKRAMDIQRHRQKQRQTLRAAGVPIGEKYYGDAEMEVDDDDNEVGEAQKLLGQKRIKETTNVLKTIFEILGQNKEDTQLVDKVTRAITTHINSGNKLGGEGTVPRNTFILETLKDWTREISEVVGVIHVINNNVTKILDANSDKIRLYLSTLQTIFRLRWYVTLGMSNSTSVDLSHLNAHLPLQLEDSTVMTMSHPILQLVFPEIFATMFVEEQTLRDTLVNQRKNKTMMLNHPNLMDSLTSSQYAVGAGGSGPQLFSLSTLTLNESTLLNEFPTPVISSAVDDHHQHQQREKMVKKKKTDEEATDTGGGGEEDDKKVIEDTSCGTDSNPTIVNPFLNGKLDYEKESKFVVSNGKCGYLEVSAPTQFSGMINSTVTSDCNKDDEEMVDYISPDNKQMRFPKLKPYVLATDANEPLMDSLSHKNLTLTDCSHEIGILDELLVAIEMTLGRVEANKTKDYEAMITQVWDRIRSNVTKNMERVLEASASAANATKLKPAVSKVKVTENRSIIISGENIPDRSSDYCQLFSTTLKTLLETAHSQLRKSASKANSTSFSNNKSYKEYYKSYYDRVLNAGISLRESLSQLVAAPEAFASVDGTKISREGAAVNLAEKFRLLRALEDSPNNGLSQSSTSSSASQFAGGIGSAAPLSPFHKLVGPQLGSYVKGYLSVKRLKKIVRKMQMDLKDVTQTTLTMVEKGVDVNENIKKIKEALTIVDTCEAKVWSSLVKYLVASDYMSLNRADLSPHINLLTSGGPNNEFSSLMLASDPSGNMFSNGEATQLLSSFTDTEKTRKVLLDGGEIPRHEDGVALLNSASAASANSPGIVFSRDAGLVNDNLPPRSGRTANNMAFENIHNYKKNATFTGDRCSSSAQANYRDDIGGGVSVYGAYNLINLTGDDKADRVRKALSSAIMNRSNQNMLSNAFLGSSVVEATNSANLLGADAGGGGGMSDPIGSLLHSQQNAMGCGDDMFNTRGRREQMASSIINVLRANPKLFVQTLTALGNFDSTAKVANSLGRIYNSVGGDGLLGATHKNNCGNDIIIHEVGMVNQGTANNTLWVR